jgi:uncharacterized membrane protein YfcA
MTILAPPGKFHWAWFVRLLLFYCTLLWLVIGMGYWQSAKEHWPIALAMALGSYAAGAAPMGGGTIGFPVLVLFFDMPASLCRDFSFAVQSIGMTSASIFILSRRQPLASALLKGALPGSVIGTPLGILFVAPYIPDLWTNVVFAVVWAGFGLLHFLRIGEIAAHKGMVEFNEGWDVRVGIVVGMLSGITVVSVTGVGIDMVAYAALVLICRADLKIAIPTSVVIMAFSSVYGIGIKWLLGDIQEGVFDNWLAAAPGVALGAPLGAFMVAYIGRKVTLLFVAVLCVGQFIWTCWAEYAALQAHGIAIALLAVAAVPFVFKRLRVWGRILSGELPGRQSHSASPGYREVEAHVHSVKAADGISTKDFPRGDFS